MTINNKIYVEKIKEDTIDFLLKAVGNTKGHIGELLAKTDDKEGYYEIKEFIDALEANLEYFIEHHKDKI